MAGTVIVDCGFLVSLVRQRDAHRHWASTLASTHPPPWHTCDAALSETFYLTAPEARPALSALLRRRAVLPSFDLGAELDPVLSLMDKYADVPMSLADACLVRMSEILRHPVILTTDGDFRIYRRHGRRVVPCILPD